MLKIDLEKLLPLLHESVSSASSVIAAVATTAHIADTAVGVYDHFEDTVF